jgi:hypothetical protein
VTSPANNLTTVRGYDAVMGRLTSLRTGSTATPKSLQDLAVALAGTPIEGRYPGARWN